MITTPASVVACSSAARWMPESPVASCARVGSGSPWSATHLISRFGGSSDWRLAFTAGVPERKYLQSSGRFDEAVAEIEADASEVQATHANSRRLPLRWRRRHPT